MLAHSRLKVSLGACALPLRISSSRPPVIGPRRGDLHFADHNRTAARSPHLSSRRCSSKNSSNTMDVEQQALGAPEATTSTTTTHPAARGSSSSDAAAGVLTRSSNRTADADTRDEPLPGGSGSDGGGGAPQPSGPSSDVQELRQQLAELMAAVQAQHATIAAQQRALEAQASNLNLLRAALHRTSSSGGGGAGSSGMPLRPVQTAASLPPVQTAAAVQGADAASAGGASSAAAAAASASGVAIGGAAAESGVGLRPFEAQLAALYDRRLLGQADWRYHSTSRCGGEGRACVCARVCAQD